MSMHQLAKYYSDQVKFVQIRTMADELEFQGNVMAKFGKQKSMLELILDKIKYVYLKQPTQVCLGLVSAIITKIACLNFPTDDTYVEQFYNKFQHNFDLLII